MRFLISLFSTLTIAGTVATASGCSSDLDLPSDPGTGESGGGAGGPSSPSVEFEMGVASVDAGGGTLTLTNGTLILVTGGTAISPEGDLLDLTSTAAAVTRGRPVRAEGRGTVESAGPPSVVAASTLKIEVDD